MNGITKYPISKGLNLYYIKGDRFKTVDIEVRIYSPLTKESASMNALITPTLKSGCKSYPSAKLINTRLEELYGANLSASASKSGESSAAVFSLSYVNEKYIQNEDMSGAFDLLCDIIFEPQTENDSFIQSYFDLEKKNLIEAIESLVNDKKSYASWRCKEEMCKGEAYSIFSLGSVEKIKSISSKEAYEYYKTKFLSGKIDIFVCGNTDIDKIYNCIYQRFPKSETENYPETKIIKDVSEVRNVVEELEVEQGKLSMGFRTGIAPSDKEYYALSMFNKIFGGTATSKLFNNVREKLSLAYYVSSGLERFKGIMTINAGVEIPTFKAAYDEIMVQLAAMQKGEFSDEEINAAYMSSVNSLQQISDSPRQLIQYYASQLPTGGGLDIDEYLSKLKAVTREDITAAANKIKLDTVYFLKNKEGNNE